MLDFSHLTNSHSVDTQYFEEGTTATGQWMTWRKPRGVKFIYMIGVGGGGAGGTSIDTANNAAGAGGGGSGAQSTIMIPSFFVPDMLYVRTGSGGFGSTVGGTLGQAGTATVVAIQPYATTSAGSTILYANGGTGGGSGSETVAGLGGSGGVVAAITDMPLAGRGTYSFFTGQTGGAGGLQGSAAPSITVPTTGLMVTAGSGGGGSATAGGGGQGGAINSPAGTLGQDYYITIPGGVGATASVPAGNGTTYAARNFVMNYGGTGGGGAAVQGGRIAGVGGNASAGAGGGGSGGGTNSNPGLKAGDGGAGFVYILSW